MGYVKHPLEQLLEWLDRAMLWLENFLMIGGGSSCCEVNSNNFIHSPDAPRPTGLTSGREWVATASPVEVTNP